MGRDSRQREKRRREKRLRNQRKRVRKNRKSHYESEGRAPKSGLSDGHVGTPRTWLDFASIQLGFKDLFGCQATWPAIEARVCGYGLNQALDILGQVSGVLRLFDLTKRDAAQDFLTKHLLKEHHPRLEALIRNYRMTIKSRGCRSGVALFGENQVIVAAKLAIRLNARPKLGKCSLTAMGEALLMITDMMTDARPIKDANDLHLHLAAEAMFSRGGNLMHELARAYLLYMCDPVELKGTGDYVCLPQLVKTITGVDVETWWPIMFVFFGHWQRFSLKRFGSGGNGISVERYLTASLSFSREQADALYSLACRTSDEMRDDVEDFESAFNPRDTLPLAKHPLVNVGGFLFCPSIQLMEERLTHGMYHLFLDPATASSEERRRFQRSLGRVFEHYAMQLLVRSFGQDKMGVSLFSEEHLNSYVSGKCCDALVLEGETVILFEFKASIMPFAVRSGRSWGDFSAKLDQIFVTKGAAQLDNTLRAIEKGDLEHVGLRGASIKWYIPIVVTLDGLAITPLTYQELWKRISERHLLVDPKCAPFQTLEISDLELLEDEIRRGTKISDLVKHKLRVDETARQSFRNYAWSAGHDFVRTGMNQHLRNTLDDIAGRGAAYIQGKARQ